MCHAEIEDFIGGSATVQFNPGESEACFEIIITDDSNPESPETFAIDFSFSLPPDMPGNIPSVSSMVTIIDNDVGKVLCSYAHTLHPIFVEYLGHFLPLFLF